MTLIKHAIRFRSPFTLAPFKPNYAFSFRQSANHFSTGTEQPPPPQDSSFVRSPGNTGPSSAFFFSPETSMVYARLSGIAKHTLKTDIINTFEGCNLTPGDIKVAYDSNYRPLGMMVKFSSYNAYDTAYKAMGKKDRLYRLDKEADPRIWDTMPSYDGKTVLLQGIPLNAIPEDVERFLSGCQYDSSSTQLFTRGPMEKASLVSFHSRTEAMNAVIMKNRGFCLNNQISMRVLE